MARRLFLERRTYRLNRLQDAARLLPILGLVLIFTPVFIGGSGDAEGVAESGAARSVSATLVYYFVIWSGLIGLTAIVSRAVVRLGAAKDQPPGAEDG